MAKFTSPAVTGIDLAACYRAFEKDLGLHCYQTEHTHSDDRLVITTVVVRVVGETRFKVFEQVAYWHPSDVPLLNKKLAAIHRAYHEADRRAHMPPDRPRSHNKH
jgi:hypothetical protein